MVNPSRHVVTSAATAPRAADPARLAFDCAFCPFELFRDAGSDMRPRGSATAAPATTELFAKSRRLTFLAMQPPRRPGRIVDQRSPTTTVTSTAAVRTESSAYARTTNVPGRLNVTVVVAVPAVISGDAGANVTFPAPR